MRLHLLRSSRSRFPFGSSSSSTASTTMLVAAAAMTILTMTCCQQQPSSLAVEAFSIAPVAVSPPIAIGPATAKDATGAASAASAASFAASSSYPSSSSSGHLTRGIQTYLADALSSAAASAAVAIVPPACAADAPTTAAAGISTPTTITTATATTTATSTTTIVAAAAAASPPTNDEIVLLREALAAVYGQPRDSTLALAKLDQAIAAWQRQPPDERAALVRVRGDVHMDLKLPQKAAADYSTAIQLLEGPGGDKADASELPAARLGRARAMRGAFLAGAQTTWTQDDWTTVAHDYQMALRLSSRDDYLDTLEEREADGAQRNPYAAWEWGMALRGAGRHRQASETHTLAAFAFRDIGDRARSVVAELDAGIDLAAAAAAAAAASSTNGGSDNNNYYRDAKELLEKAIPKTTGITSGTDVELLQRVIAKEGEARIALAALLWDAGDQAGAQRQLGEACVRFDELNTDAADREAARLKKGLMPPPKYNKVVFSIDDIPGAGGKVSCARFQNEEFLTRTVEWPEALRQKVQKLSKLG